MHSLAMADAIWSHARAEVSMISISIANRHYNAQKVCMPYESNVRYKKLNRAIVLTIVLFLFNVAVPHVVIICQKYLVKFQ